MSTYDLTKFLKDTYIQLDGEIQVTSIKAGVENSNYLVDYKGKRYVFRVYNQEHSIRGKRSRDQIDLELLFSQKTFQFGLKTPKVITGRNSEQIQEIILNNEKHFCALFTFLSGESPIKFDESISGQLGNAVKIITKAGFEFREQTVLPKNTTILDRSFEKYQQVLDKGLENKLNTRIVDLYHQLKSSKEEMVSGLSTGLVHGDVKLENVFFENGILSAILDFDDFRYSYLLEDLVMTLMHNLHSQTENMLRAGFYNIFVSQFEGSFIGLEIERLSYLLKARLVYDCCKYTITGKEKLVSEILSDPQVEKFILNK